MVYETITPAIANVNMKKELGDKAPKAGTSEWQQEILERSKQLKEKYSVDALISMRQSVTIC